MNAGGRDLPTNPVRRELVLIRLVVLLLLAAISVPIGAQDAAPAADAPAADDLARRSLGPDIDTARIEELQAWCRVLGLSEIGTEDTLRLRLRDYYGLGSAASAVTPDVSPGTTVRIESAGRSEYFTVDPGDGTSESVVRLSGGVVLIVDEADRGRSHRVEAESVVFNQDRDTITASGDIAYTVDTGGRKEYFSGDSLLFEVNDWTGVIFRGTSRRNEDVDGEDIEFLFRGDSIQRSGTDILILEGGTISSDDSEDPDYSLRARKIWITGPGEWGLFSATLFVGRVPVFYLPFYWKSGSDLLFNPVIGTRTGAGYYIQTTTYLLGRKSQSDDFSIMGFGDSASEDTVLVRDGLFLVRGAAGPDRQNQDADGRTLKFMLDGYTALGAMTGLEGRFPNLGDASIDFSTSVAVSRSVTEDNSPYYSVAGTPTVFWNDSYIGGFRVPFRWGTWVDARWKDWSLRLDWYSDPYYVDDFGARKENFDWLSFLLSERESSGVDEAVLGDMRWSLDGSYSHTFDGWSPWLQSFAMDHFRTSLDWRTDANTALTQADSADNPARDFFYPDRLILPDLKLSVRGGSPVWTVDRFDLDTPPVGPTEADLPYRESFSTLNDAGLASSSIDYNLQTQLFIEDDFASESWDEPADVDFGLDAARINTTQRGELNYRLDLWDGLTGLSSSTSLNGYYQTHGDLFGTGATVDGTTRLEDYQYSKLIWNGGMSVYLKPFQGIPSLSESRMEYGFDADLYTREFDPNADETDPEYINDWLTGSEDIARHEASAQFVWTGGPFTLGTSTTGRLPPLDPRNTLGANAAFQEGGWEAGVDQQFLYENEDWTVQPLVMKLFWSGFGGEATFRQSARFDGAFGRFASAETVVGLWGFETRFNAAYGPRYSWTGAPSYTWNEIAGGDRFGPSTLSFSYDRDIISTPRWKNRIKFTTGLHTSWDINLIQPTDNVLTFQWTQELEIYKFLDLELSFSSTNKSMYLYFPWWRDRLGIADSVGFFEDLARSFNFFDVEQRRSSQFNMDRVDVSLVHHLGSWDLSVEYSGWPSLDTGANSYRWESEFGLYIKWNPLPMFNQRIGYDDEAWTVDSFESDS